MNVFSFLFITGVLRSSSMMARAAADLKTGLNIACKSHNDISTNTITINTITTISTKTPLTPQPLPSAMSNLAGSLAVGGGNRGGFNRGHIWAQTLFPAVKKLSYQTPPKISI